MCEKDMLLNSNEFDKDNTRLWLDACRGYKTEHGNLLVTNEYITPNSLPLGKWLMWQRVKYKNGIIKPDLRVELENLGMIWDEKVLNAEIWINTCRQYVAEYGNLLFAKDYVTPDGAALGSWLYVQRFLNKRGLISPKIKTELDKLGMVWES